MILSMHYNIEVIEKRRLMIAKIYGIWNIETAQEYTSEYREMAKPLLSTKENGWAKLSILTNWKSSYPEIAEIIGKHIIWCRDHGARWIAYVIDNPVTLNQLKKIIKAGQGENSTRVFKTLREAELFLVEQGY